MSHNHTHNALDRSVEKNRLRAALIVTLSIMIAEFVGGLLSGSLALLSDAGHMLTDSATLFLSFIAIRIAQARRADQYTFGWKRIEILAALINGFFLLAICAYIGYEGIQRLLHPKEVDTPTMLVIACIGLVANIFCASILSHSHNLNVRSAFLHVVADLLSSIGVVIGATVMLFSPITWIDPALSLVIAGMVLMSGMRVIREAASILMEAAPEGINVNRVRESLLRYPDLLEVHDLHIWTITSGMLSLSCHAVIDRNSISRSDQIIQGMNKLLSESFGISHTTIQIESPAFSANSDSCLDCE